MDPRLAGLISEYQTKVRIATAVLQAAGIPLPESNRAWVDTRIADGCLPHGFRCFKHGCGCFVEGPDWSVDFDFGDHGEVDGFDSWRLRRFVGSPTLFGFRNGEDIERAMGDAEEAGEIRRRGNLFYVTD